MVAGREVAVLRHDGGGRGRADGRVPGVVVWRGAGVAAARYQPEYSEPWDGRAIGGGGEDGVRGGDGHAHIDEAEIWRVTLGGRPSYTRLTEPGTKNLWPMWTPDGRRVLFM